MRSLAVALILTVLVTAAACREPGTDVSAEIASQRILAARHACVGEQLLDRAQDDLETLAAVEEGGIASAVLAYQRAFTQHATLRNAVYSHLDSAVNHARTSADSLRHAEAANRLTILRPLPETVEANVLEQYNRRASEILADDGHPCNWRHELDERRR
jgi:hypothetical protein